MFHVLPGDLHKVGNFAVTQNENICKEMWKSKWIRSADVGGSSDHVVCRLLWWSSGPHLTYGFLQPQLKCVVKKAQKWKKVNAGRVDGSEQNLA